MRDSAGAFPGGIFSYGWVRSEGPLNVCLLRTDSPSARARNPRPTDHQGSATALATDATFYSLETYDTREQAMVVARALIEAKGPSYADDLDLFLESESGDIRHLVSGGALLVMAGVDQRASAD